MPTRIFQYGQNVDNSATFGIDLNAKNHVGQTAFHLACRFGHFDVAKMLIEDSTALSINLNATDNAGVTAYNLGLISGSKSTKELMLNNADTLQIDDGFNKRRNKIIKLD